MSTRDLVDSCTLTLGRTWITVQNRCCCYGEVNHTEECQRMVVAHFRFHMVTFFFWDLKVGPKCDIVRSER